MNSRSLLKENAGLLEIVQRLLDPILVVASGAALYAVQFESWDLPRNYVFLLISGFLLCLVVFPFFNLYRPQRGASLWVEIQGLASAWALLFAGLIVGLAAAILRSRLDTSVRTSDDLTRVTGMPTLGVIASDRDAAGRPLLLHANPRSDRAEAFRQLRTNLRFVDVDRRPRSIVIASALPGEGKTTTAANLAITLAEAGLRVVLVNADLRRPGLGLYMGIEESVGLTSVLIGSAELADAVQELGNGLLRVLPSGPLPPNPSELLGSIGMRQVIQGLERDNDIVLLDSPPLLTVTDASVLSATAGGVIVVVRSGKTKLGELKQALAGLQTVGAHILGGVVNMAPRNGSNAQRYSHRYGDDYSKRSRRHVEAVPMEPGAVQVVPPQADEVRPSAAVARLETAD